MKKIIITPISLDSLKLPDATIINVAFADGATLIDKIITTRDTLINHNEWSFRESEELRFIYLILEPSVVDVEEKLSHILSIPKLANEILVSLNHRENNEQYIYDIIAADVDVLNAMALFNTHSRKLVASHLSGYQYLHNKHRELYTMPNLDLADIHHVFNLGHKPHQSEAQFEICADKFGFPLYIVNQ